MAMNLSSAQSNAQCTSRVCSHKLRIHRRYLCSWVPRLRAVGSERHAAERLPHAQPVSKQPKEGPRCVNGVFSNVSALTFEVTYYRSPEALGSGEHSQFRFSFSHVKASPQKHMMPSIRRKKKEQHE